MGKPSRKVRTWNFNSKPDVATPQHIHHPTCFYRPGIGVILPPFDHRWPFATVKHQFWNQFGDSIYCVKCRERRVLAVKQGPYERDTPMRLVCYSCPHNGEYVEQIPHL